MNLDRVIGQIKQFAPVFNGNVAGAAAHANGVDNQVWLPLPAAYVVPGSDDAEPNRDLAALYQIVTERFEVIVVFDNSADRRGQEPTASYETVKLALFGALLNWRPDSSADNPGLVDSADPQANRSARGLFYGGGEFMGMDRARLFYAWTFCLLTTFTDADGWQPPSEPLTDIQITVPSDVPGSTTSIEVDVPIGQPGELGGFQLDVDLLS